MNRSHHNIFCGFLAALFFVTFSFCAIARTMEDFPVVKLKSLDKITARTETFEARVGSTVKFDDLFIKVQSCRKSSPIEEPESASFLQIWEADEQGEARWVFSGWMFASSPALSPMDHPIYDVWVIDCLSDQAPEKKDDEIKGEIETPDDAVNEISDDAPSENDVD